MIQSRFRAIDGEGIDGVYSLLSSSTGEDLIRQGGIGSEAALDWLLSLPQGPINIGYGISYDVNMILREMPKEAWEALYLPTKAGKFPLCWRGYELSYVPRRILKIRRGSKKFVWYDVLGFFQSSFRSSIKKHLHVTDALIDAGKADRGLFTWDDLAFVQRYNGRELELLVQLMERLATMLESQGIALKHWYGPGAIANAFLQRIKLDREVAASRPDYTPPALADAWDRAYFGGRIEALIRGTVADLYQYDINSAYPYAASCIAAFEPWQYTRYFDPEAWHAVYHCQWDLGECRIGPLPWRHKSGAVSFPANGRGWYHAPEVIAARAKYGTKIRVLEGWKQSSEGRESALRPLILSTYQRRQELKQVGDDAEHVLKLALNSLYGKLAQRVGSRQFWCLSYAGFITSFTRARMFQAACDQESAILAYATDGILSKTRLDLPISKSLGDWTEDEFPRASVLMSGLYHLSDGAGRTRKLARRGLGVVPDMEDVLDQLNETQHAKVIQRMFVTARLSHHYPNAHGPQAFQFKEVTKTLNPFSPGKREFERMSIQDWRKDSVDSIAVRSDGTMSAARRNPDALIALLEEARIID